LELENRRACAHGPSIVVFNNVFVPQGDSATFKKAKQKRKLVQTPYRQVRGRRWNSTVFWHTVKIDVWPKSHHLACDSGLPRRSYRADACGCSSLVAAQIDKEKALECSFGEMAWLRQLQPRRE
jgi:hypothetical protein